MSQRKHIVQRALEIQKDVRIRVIATAGIAAGTFALPFGHVDPALLEGEFQRVAVFLPHRFQGRLHRFHGLLPCVMATAGRQQRIIDIVHVQLVQFQHLAAHFQVALQMRDAAVDRLNQLAVNAFGNFVAEQCGVQRGWKMPHVRRNRMAFHGEIQRRCECIAVLFICGIKLAERGLADVAIRVLHEQMVRPVRQFHRFACAVLQLAERQIAVVQDGERAFRCAEHFGIHAQKPFLRFGQRVFAAAQRLLDAPLVERQRVRFQIRIHGFGRNRQQFRIEPRETRREFGEQRFDATDAAAVF